MGERESIEFIVCDLSLLSSIFQFCCLPFAMRCPPIPKRVHYDSASVSKLVSHNSCNCRSRQGSLPCAHSPFTMWPHLHECLLVSLLFQVTAHPKAASEGTQTVHRTITLYALGLGEIDVE